MAKLHHLHPEEGVHGFVSRDLAPALSIDSGDRVFFKRSIRVGARSSKSETFPSRANSVRAIWAAMWPML